MTNPNRETTDPALRQDLILQVPGIPGVEECWALDCYSRPEGGFTDTGLLVRRAKYGGLGPPAAELGKQLGSWGVRLAQQRHWPDGLVIVPIPSSGQLVSALMRNVSGSMKVPVRVSLKSRSTKRIKFLPLLGRNDAAFDNMAVRTRDVPQHVLLIDDVVQTGATLAAAAALLRQAGALRVFALVAARVSGPGLST